MASTIQTFQFAIKDRYDVIKHVENLTLGDRPLMAMIAKNTEFAGENTIVPLIYGRPQGVAATTVAQAQTNATNLEGKRFLLEAGTINGSVSIGDRVITASRSNPGAFLRNKIVEIDNLYEQMADDVANMLYSNGGNSIGAIATYSATGGAGGFTRITLTEPSQAINFEVGMKVDSSANDGSTSGTVVIAASTVAAVDRSTGTIDFTAASLGFTTTHFLFRTGNYGGLAAVTTFPGVSAFIWPDDSPPTLLGMTRTEDTQRLAGCRVPSADLAGRNIEERLQLLGSYMMGRYKGKGASHGFMNPEDFTSLSIALQSRGVVPMKDSSTRFGFDAISVNLGGRTVKIFSDPWCPKGTFFALRLKDWTLYSMEKLIHTVSEDGLTLLRGATANDYEYRLVSYPSAVCVAPGYSGRVALA